MLWQELKSRQIGALSGKEVVLIPIAAIEQHGPHLPLGTDSLIAESMASSVDERCGKRLLLLPVQRIGYSPHHMAFPGTLSLSHEAFSNLIQETIGSVMAHGLNRILILNSHGGNQAIGEVIAQKVAERSPECELVLTSWWRIASSRLKDLVEGPYPSVGHACEFETSLMLHLFPDLVEMSLAEDDGLPAMPDQLQGDLFTKSSSATRVFAFDKLTRQGVFGRPTLASAEKGKKILEIVTAELKSLIVDCWPDAFDK